VPTEKHDLLGAEDFNLGGTEEPIREFGFVGQVDDAVIVGTPEGAFHHHGNIAEFIGSERGVGLFASVLEMIDTAGMTDGVWILLADEQPGQIHLMNQVGGQVTGIIVPVLLKRSAGPVRQFRRGATP